MTILGRESEGELGLLAKHAFSFIVLVKSHVGTASCISTTHTEYGSKSNEFTLENPYFTARVTVDHIVQSTQEDNHSWTKSKSDPYIYLSIYTCMHI